MFHRIFLFLLLFCAMAVEAHAQTENKRPIESEKTVQKAEAAQELEEEEVNGLWELSGYLAKKLASEMGSRMNLEDGEKEALKKKRVKIKIGPIKVERIE